MPHAVGLLRVAGQRLGAVQEQPERELVRLPLELADGEQRVPLDEEMAGSRMQPVMRQLMRADEALPLERQIGIDHDIAAAQLAVIEAARRIAEPRLLDDNVQPLRQLKRTVRFVFPNQLAYDVLNIHAMHPAVSRFECSLFILFASASVCSSSSHPRTRLPALE